MNEPVIVLNEVNSRLQNKPIYHLSDKIYKETLSKSTI